MQFLEYQFIVKSADGEESDGGGVIDIDRIIAIRGRGKEGSTIVVSMGRGAKYVEYDSTESRRTLVDRLSDLENVEIAYDLDYSDAKSAPTPRIVPAESFEGKGIKPEVGQHVQTLMLIDNDNVIACVATSFQFILGMYRTPGIKGVIKEFKEGFNLYVVQHDNVVGLGATSLYSAAELMPLEDVVATDEQ